MKQLVKLDVFTHFSLQRLNTLAVPSVAGNFVAVDSQPSLQEALALADELSLPVLVLGGGSNVVLPEQFPGLVIQVAIPGIDVVAEDDECVWLEVGAGVVWEDLVNHCLNFHYWGIENLTLIPGTVGAAPIQNIGAYGVELQDVFAELKAVERRSRLSVTFDSEACEFGYRHSVFKGRLRDHYVITHVTLKLAKQPQATIHYPSLQQALASHDPASITPIQVCETIRQIRRSKLPDPAEIPNAGSFFKNPVVTAGQFDRLQQQFPGIVGFPVAAGEQVKIAAGWLLEQAGWKGVRDFGVGMHEKQALVLVNPGGKSGQQVVDFAREVQADIVHRYGIELEIEPIVYV